MYVFCSFPLIHNNNKHVLIKTFKLYHMIVLLNMNIGLKGFGVNKALMGFSSDRSTVCSGPVLVNVFH